MTKYLFILFSWLICFSAKSQQNAVVFDHMALSVTNLKKSVEFYRKTLGLKEITNKTKQPGIRWMSLGEGKELHLVSTIDGNIEINKAVHMAVKVKDFDAFIERLRSMNITFSDWPGELNVVSVRADGIRQIYFQDPDGYWIEVNSATL